MLNVTGTTARQQALVDSIRLSMRFERSFIRRAVPILDRQARAAANVYKETEDLPATLIAVDAFTESWEDRYEKHYLQVGEKIGKRFYDDLKSEGHYVETKDFESFFLDFMRFVGFKSAEKVQLINDTTKKIIKTAVSLARNFGEGPDAIAKSIYGKISGIGKTTARVRCRLIARTETHFAYNYANQMAADNAGLDLEKEWMSAEDERTRPDHADADGQRVDLKEAFSIGGTSMMYPGDDSAPPKQVCNCRCTTGHHTRSSVRIVRSADLILSH